MGLGEGVNDGVAVGSGVLVSVAVGVLAAAFMAMGCGVGDGVAASGGSAGMGDGFDCKASGNCASAWGGLAGSPAAGVVVSSGDGADWPVKSSSDGAAATNSGGGTGGIFTGGITIGTGVLVFMPDSVGDGVRGVAVGMTGAGEFCAVGATASGGSAYGPISVLVLFSKKKLNTQNTTKFRSSR